MIFLWCDFLFMNILYFAICLGEIFKSFKKVLYIYRIFYKIPHIFLVGQMVSFWYFAFSVLATIQEYSFYLCINLVYSTRTRISPIFLCVDILILLDNQSLNRENFISSFLILILCNSFSCLNILIRASETLTNINYDSGHSYFIPNREKAVVFYYKGCYLL